MQITLYSFNVFFFNFGFRKFKLSEGSYLYMEASGQMEGDTAIVKTPFENIPPNKVYCFLF